MSPININRIFADALNSLNNVPEFWELSLDDHRVRAFKRDGSVFIPKLVQSSFETERAYSTAMASFDGIFALPVKAPSCDTTNFERVKFSKLAPIDLVPATPVALLSTPVAPLSPLVESLSMWFNAPNEHSFVAHGPPTLFDDLLLNSDMSISEIYSFIAGSAVSDCTELTIPDSAVEITPAAPCYSDLLLPPFPEDFVSPDPCDLPIPTFVETSSICITQTPQSLCYNEDVPITMSPIDFESFALADPSLCFWDILPYLTVAGQDKFVHEHSHFTSGCSAFTIFKFLEQFCDTTHVPSFTKVYFGKLHCHTDTLISRTSALKFLYSNRFCRVGYTDLYNGYVLRHLLDDFPYGDFETGIIYRSPPPTLVTSYPLALYPMGVYSSPLSPLARHVVPPPHKERIVLSDPRPTTFSYIYDLIDSRLALQSNLDRKQRFISKKIMNTISKIKIDSAKQSRSARLNSFADTEGLLNLIPGGVSATALLDKATSLLSEIPAGAMAQFVDTTNSLMSESTGTLKNAGVVLDFFASVVTYLRDIQNDASLALDYLQRIIEKVFSWLGDFFPADSIVPIILKSITPHDGTYTFFWVCLIGILLWNIIFGGRHLNKLIIIILLIAVPFLSHFNILSLIIQFVCSLTGDLDFTHDCVGATDTFFDSTDDFATREMFEGMDWSKPLILLLSTVTFIGANKFANCNSWMADQTKAQAQFGAQFNNMFNGMKNWNSMIDSIVTDTVDEWTKFDTTLFGLTGILAEEVRADFVRLDQIEHWPNRESLYSDPDFHDELLRISERLRKYSHETDRLRFPARFNERLIKADRLLTGFITESTKRKGQEDNFRFDPIHTSFYGEPGVGKSFLVNVMIHDILDFFGKPKLNRIYYRNPAVPFFSGYCGQHAMMIDDANSLKTDLDSIDSLQLKSSVPHQVNMAALADKGRMFTSEFIFSTTNEKLFTNSRDIKCTGAINRRRDILIEVEKDGDFVPNPTAGKRFFILNPLNGLRISEGLDYFELMMTLLPFYQDMYNTRKQSTEDMNACVFKKDWRSIIGNYTGGSNQTKFDYHNKNFKVVAHKCIEKEDSNEFADAEMKKCKCRHWTCEDCYPSAFRQMAEKVEVVEADPMLKWATKMVEVQPNFYMIMDPALAPEFLALEDADQKRAIYYYKNYCAMEFESEKLAEMKLSYAREMRDVNIFTYKVRLDENDNFVYPDKDTYYSKLFDNMSEIQKFASFEILKYKFKYESLGEARRLGWLEHETEEVAKPFLSQLSTATKCTIGAVVGTAVTYGVMSFLKGWTSKGKPIEHVKVDNVEKELIEDKNYIEPEARARRPHKQPKDPYSDEKINRDPNVKKLVFEGRTFDDKNYYFRKGGAVDKFSEAISNSTRVLSCKADNKYYAPKGDYQIKEFRFSLKFDSIIWAKRDFKINKYVYTAEELVRETLITKSVEFPQELEILDNGIEQHLRMSTTLFDIDEAFKNEIERAQAEGTCDPAGWDFGFKKMYNNTGYITNRFGSLHSIMLGPNRMLIPKHFFFKFDEKLENGASIELRIKEVIYDFKYYENEVVFHPTKDLALWEIPSSIPHFPSIRKYIGSGEEAVRNANLKGVMIPSFREVAYGKLILHVGHTSNVGPSYTTRKYSLKGYTSEESPFDDLVYELKGHEYFINSAKGDCGAAVVGLNPDLTQKLIGIHIAGWHKEDSRGYSVVLCKETIDKLDQVLNDRFWKGNFPHNIAPPPIEKLLESGIMRAPKFKPDPRNHIVDTGFMREMNCPNINDKTSIIHSELFGLTGGESVRDTAILSIDDPRNVDKVEPLIEGINKYSHKGVNLPKNDMNIIADYMGEYIRNAIGKQREGFGKLSADTAINGWATEDYMEGLNMKTSAGWPFCTKIKTKDGKKSLFTVVGEQSNGAPLYEMCDELREAVQHKYDCVMSGAKSASLFFECLKDERVKPKKIYPCKTRLFSIADVATIIVSRMFMLDFCCAIMKNRENLGPQVGINCDSPQWDHLFARLKANSPYGFACDYSAFDSTQDGTVLDAACRVMNDVCRTSEKDALARATLFNEMYSRLTIVGSKVVLLRRGLASGVSVTAIVNSIVNEIYLRFAWMHLARQFARDLISQENFDLFVVAVYYGDDNVVSVKPEVRDWFNLRSIATFLSKYGITMTDAKKNNLEDCEEYDDIENLTFLKREFKIDPQSGFVFAPLEINSIEERPQWTKKKLGPAETLDNVNSSLRDALHHGREYFCDLQERLRKACHEAKIGPFPTMVYGDLYQEFLDKRLEGKVITSNVCINVDRTPEDFLTHVQTLLREDPDVLGFEELKDADLDIIKSLDQYDCFIKKKDHVSHTITLSKKELNAFEVPEKNKFVTILEFPETSRRVAHCHLPVHATEKKKFGYINHLVRKNVDAIFGDLYINGLTPRNYKKITPNKSFVFNCKRSPDSVICKKEISVKILSSGIAFGIDKKGLSDHKYIVYSYDGFQKCADKH